MARPREYGSDAERQRAYRERKRLEQSGLPDQRIGPDRISDPSVTPSPDPGRLVAESSAESLPPDIAAVWRSERDQGTARALIAAWGLDAFRTSELHKQALLELVGVERRRANQRAFLASRA